MFVGKRQEKLEFIVSQMAVIGDPFPHMGKFVYID